MNLGELRAELKSNILSKCYLLLGEDSFIMRSAYDAVRGQIPIDYEDLNVNTFSENINSVEALKAILTFPFMSKKRLVVMKEYYPTDGDFNGIKNEFLGRGESDTILIIMNTKKHDLFAKNLKLIKVVECNHPDAGACAKWIKNKLFQANLKIDEKLAYNIAEYSLCDMAQIDMQVEKIISYLAGKDAVSSGDIDTLVEKRGEYKIYEFTNAIAAKNRNMAYKTMKSLLSGKTEEVLLLGSIYAHFRRLLICKISKSSVEELAGLLGVKEYAVKKTLEQARKFTAVNLKNIIELLAKADLMCKSGQRSIETALEFIVLKLINL